MSGQKMSFDDWCKALDAQHEILRNTEEGFEGYGRGSVIDKTGSECWRDYYDQELSPMDALSEDRDHWD